MSSFTSLKGVFASSVVGEDDDDDDSTLTPLLLERQRRQKTVLGGGKGVFVNDDDDDDSTLTPLLLERQRRQKTVLLGGGKGVFVKALATTTLTTTTMMMMVAAVAFVVVVALKTTTTTTTSSAAARLGTNKEHHHHRLGSIGNNNVQTQKHHVTTTTTKRKKKAFKTALAPALRKGKKEEDQQQQQQQQATCPQTYVRITDTSVKGHDVLEEEEDGKMTQSVGRYDYRESTRECEDACNKNPTCVGFVDDATERYCTFKDAVEGDDMVDDVGRDSYKKLEVTSYYVPHFNKWVSARESEDENAEHEKFVYEESAEECEEICTESTTCEAYVDYKDAKTPYCRFKTKDYVQSVLSTPAKDLYSKKTCVPGQPVGKEVLDEFEEKPTKEESDEEKKSESEEKEKECVECEDDDDDDDAHLAAMKKEAIETFLKRKKETSAMKEAIEAAKAKKNEKSKTTGVTSLPPPKGVVGHSKKPTWVKVIEDDADEGEETDDIEEEQPKIKAILTSTDDDDVSSSASKTRTSKTERLAQSHKVTNFGDIAKAKAKKEEALAYARKLFDLEKKVKAELAAKKAKEDAEAKKAAIIAKKKAEKMKAKKEAEEKAAAEEKARLEEEEKKRLEEEEYKKNWAARWMANIEARTEKLTAKKEDTTRLKHASALGDSFVTFFSKMLPMRTWEKSTTIQTPTTNRKVVVDDDATQPRFAFQHQHSSVNAALENNAPDGRPTRDLSDDVALRMGGGKK